MLAGQRLISIISSVASVMLPLHTADGYNFTIHTSISLFSLFSLLTSLPFIAISYPNLDKWWPSFFVFFLL